MNQIMIFGHKALCRYALESLRQTVNARESASAFSIEHFQALAARGLFYETHPAAFFDLLRELAALSQDFPFMISMGTHWIALQLLRHAGHTDLARAAAEGQEFLGIAHEELTGDIESGVKRLKKCSAMNLTHATAVLASLRLNNRIEMIFIRPEKSEITDLVPQTKRHRTGCRGKLTIFFPLLRPTSLELGDAAPLLERMTEWESRLKAQVSLGLLQGIRNELPRVAGEATMDPLLLDFQRASRSLELLTHHANTEDLKLLSPEIHRHIRTALEAAFTIHFTDSFGEQSILEKARRDLGIDEDHLDLQIA